MFLFDELLFIEESIYYNFSSLFAGVTFDFFYVDDD